MDITELVSMLTATLQQDTRQQAEEWLKEVKGCAKLQVSYFIENLF